MEEKTKYKIYIIGILKSISIIMFLLILLKSIKNFPLKVVLILSSIILSVITNYLYYKQSKDYYFNLKHETQMKYFNRFENTSMKILNKLDKKNMADKIFNISNKTMFKEKCYLESIPSLVLSLGLLTYIVITTNWIMIIPLIILLVSTLVIRYKTLTIQEITYEVDNPKLIEFIEKMDTIRKLNIFNYAKNILNRKKESIRYTYNLKYIKNKFAILLYAFKVIVMILFLLKNTNLLTILISICLITIIDYYIYVLFLGINNHKAEHTLNKELNEALCEKCITKRQIVWHTIKIENGTFTNHGITIKIPNFELEKLDQISIMGQSGEGKSSILKILSGLYELESGTIQIDDKPKEKEINNIYISSSVAIFDSTLKDNLCLGKDIPEKKIMEYIKEVGLLSWIDKLSLGLNTKIDNNIELIIKEKINLIRAIIIDADVYLLDNPTANMDLEDEKKVTKIINKYFAKKTFVIVTDRPVITTICKKHYFMKEHILMDKEPLL